MSARQESRWEDIERPAGPQALPSWIRDAHVNWMEGYGNPPDVLFKTVGEVWDDPIYTKVGDAFIAKHPDGRLKIHWHGGAIRNVSIRVFKGEDGVVRQHPRFGPQWGDQPTFRTILEGVASGYEPGEWTDVEMRATTQQEGYAGRHFWIKMDDGETLVLRGPWRSGVPAGYTAITTVDCDKPDAWAQRRGRPWWTRTGCFGLELRDDVYIAALCTFLPHLPLARVTYSWGGTGIEPYAPDWGEPKHFFNERRRTETALKLASAVP